MKAQSHCTMDKTTKNATIWSMKKMAHCEKDKI